MKTFRLIFPLVITFVLAAMVFVMMLPAFAQSDIPEGVQIFYLDGLTCILWPDGSGDCYCPCDPVCPEPTKAPTPRGSPTPGSSPTPRGTPTPQDTPIPSSTPKIPKPKCNRGLGNLDEGCDPGNSSGQGQGGGRGAGEDRDEPRGPRH